MAGILYVSALDNQIYPWKGNTNQWKELTCPDKQNANLTVT